MLDGQRAVDGANAVGAVQGGTHRRGREYGQAAHQLGALCHIVNDLFVISNRVFCLHTFLATVNN